MVPTPNLVLEGCCEHCGRVIHLTDQGWTHGLPQNWQLWQGQRCPGGGTAAEPGGPVAVKQANEPIIDKRLCISASKTNRYVSWPFSVCATPDTLEWIGKQLLSRVEEMRARNTTYGWVQIVAPSPPVIPAGREAPKDWDAD